jgi:TolB protein
MRNRTERRRGAPRHVAPYWIAMLVPLLTPGMSVLAQTSAPVLHTSEESRWFRNVRQVTRSDMGLDRSGEAYFSPDGKRICFQAYPPSQTEYQIYVMNLEGGGLERVSTGVGATTCAYFHPDNRRLLFAANHHDPRPADPPPGYQPPASQPGLPPGRAYAWSFYPGMDLYEYTFETRSLRRLTDTDGYDAEGSYSPDGKQIVFCSTRDGDLEIYVCDADGSGARRITRHPGYDGGPFFSPDGKRIVYRSDRRGDGNMQIFTNNLDGSDERALTSADVLHWCPFWHPSGRWLIYTRADHGTPQQPKRPLYDLYLLRSDAAPGDEGTRVTFDPAFDGLPVFSPDGSRLMWTSRRGGLSAPQVFVADFIGLSAQDGLAQPAAP